MMLIIYLLLMLKGGCCEDFPFIEARTVYVGEHVRMTCSRRSAGDIFWMRIISGNSLEILEKSEDIFPHIKIVRDAGILVLQIIKARLNDSGLYFCLRKHQNNKIVMNGTNLTVKESAVTTVPTTDSPHLHDSVTLHCSALRDSQNQSCPEDENLLCFRTESIQTFPGLNYTDNVEEGGFTFNSGGCFYSYFKNSSLSDAQMYHCAVAKYDKNTSREKSNPNTKAENKRDSRNYYTVACLLSAALAICLVVIAFLIYIIIEMNKKLNGCCNVALQAHEPIIENQESQKPQKDLVYSAVSTRRKASKKRTGCTASEEQDVIYTEVNVLGV